MLLLMGLVVNLAVSSGLALSKRDSFPVESCDAFYDSPYDSYTCSNENVPSKFSCCYEKYGIMMQTQFWDSGSSSSPDASKKFTIHGLWSDECDGSYQQFCDKNLEVQDSSSLKDIIVNQFGEGDLYDTMSTYWLNDDGSNEELWQHEYNKHGTCMNTLSPECFEQPYRKYENVVNYYKKVVEIWQGLDTYSFLESEGITPSSQEFDLSDIEAALAKYHDGKKVYVGCTDSKIDQIYYYHKLRGNVLTGTYKAIDSLEKSNCPDQVIYAPKN